MKLLTLITVMLIGATLVYANDTLTADQIAQHIYDRDIGQDMKSYNTMQLISKSGHIRNRKFITLRKDDDKGQRKVFIRFTEPADIKGTAFLVLEKDSSHNTEQHLYLPALKRVRRIVSSQKGRSFVNSDFTYEDMQRHPLSEWNYKLQGEETILGIKCYILVSTPKSGTKTQYSKLISWIEKTSFLPIKTVFWNKNDKKSKIYSVKKAETIDNIRTEVDVTMNDLLSGHQTRLILENITYNSGIKDSLFTTRALER